MPPRLSHSGRDSDSTHRRCHHRCGLNQPPDLSQTFDKRHRVSFRGQVASSHSCDIFDPIPLNPLYFRWFREPGYVENRMELCPYVTAYRLHATKWVADESN